MTQEKWGWGAALVFGSDMAGGRGSIRFAAVAELFSRVSAMTFLKAVGAELFANVGSNTYAAHV